MQKKIRAAPAIIYPESDGEPMAETDTHRDLMIDFIQLLKYFYRNARDVYVSGNLFLYYVEGNPRKVISPDVFVVFGVEKKQRRSYRTWEEGRTPDFVLEVASPKTYTNDIGQKKELYASVLAVKEYFIYDPLGQIIPSFRGWRLVDGAYQEIDFVNNRLPSEVLGLELGEKGEVLRLYDPNRSVWLATPPERAEHAEIRAEHAEVRAEQEANARRSAETRVEQEANARRNAEIRAQSAEEKLANAMAEIERLQSLST